MNEILKLIEKRELYVHLILMKIYLETKGRTNDNYRGILEADFENLFGEDFELELLNDSKQYLYSEGYVTNPAATQLTTNGRRYFEDFVKDYMSLNSEESKVLLEKLPQKVVTFLGIAANSVTVIDFFKNLISL